MELKLKSIGDPLLKIKMIRMNFTKHVQDLAILTALAALVLSQVGAVEPAIGMLTGPFLILVAIRGFCPLGEFIEPYISNFIQKRWPTSKLNEE